MRVKAFIVADKIEEGKEKKTDIFGVFSTINVKSFPSILKEFSVFFNFEDDRTKKKKYKYELFLRYKELNLKILELELIKEKNDLGHTVINRIEEMPLMSSGDYELVAKINGKKVAEQIIEIKEI